MFGRIREFWQDMRAWKRGDRRVAPHGTRGRVYEKKADSGNGVHKVKTKTAYTVQARVIRADGRPDEFYGPKGRIVKNG